MGDITIGLLHPGEMGAAVGQCLAEGGHEVLWVPEGRGPVSAARAAAAGIHPALPVRGPGRGDPGAVRGHRGGRPGDEPRRGGAASAVKMAYASWTKGSAALLLAARALARAEGVEDVLLAEWGLSQHGLEARSDGAARSAAAKGWRWVAEMEEIAATMAAAGLPAGFHQAAAEIYRGSAQPGEEGVRGGETNGRSG